MHAVRLNVCGEYYLEHVRKLLAKARCCVASRAGLSRAAPRGGEEREEYWKYFECSEPISRRPSHNIVAVKSF
jgi:hypothetical protein